MRYPDVSTVLNAPLVDGYGGQRTRDWANATRTTVRCVVQPVSSDEDNDRRQTTATRWWAAYDPSAPLDPSSRVEWDGQTLEVDGEIGRWKRRGTVQHLEVTLRRATDTETTADG